MSEVRTRSVSAVPNGDGTWHLVFTRPDGSQLICPSAPEALVQRTLELENQRELTEPEHGSALAWFISMLISPTVLTAIATSIFLGKC